MADPVTCTAIAVCCACFGPWCAKRVCRSGTHDSEGWPEASEDEVRDILYAAELSMGPYYDTEEEAVEQADHVIDVDAIKRFVKTDSDGKCPAHMIYLDHVKKAVVLCIRGLQMGVPADWKILGGNKKGQHPYKGGYVHHEFFIAGQWLLEQEGPFMKELLEANPGYKCIIAGHSLGAGVAIMFSVLVSDTPGVLGDLPSERLNCYAFAPPRIMSLQLAIKYANVINSVIVQDDFLPRISTTTVKKVFPLASKTTCFCRYGITCAFCALCVRFCQDTFIGEKKMLKDEKRLYPPGRIYHIVFKDPRPCKKTHVQPKVLTQIPVKGRFERAVMNRTTFFDHNLTSAIRVLKEDIKVTDIRQPSMHPPSAQRMERQSSKIEEHSAAMKEWEKVRDLLVLVKKKKRVRVPMPPEQGTQGGQLRLESGGVAESAAPAAEGQFVVLVSKPGEEQPSLEDLQGLAEEVCAEAPAVEVVRDEEGPRRPSEAEGDTVEEATSSSSIESQQDAGRLATEGVEVDIKISDTAKGPPRVAQESTDVVSEIGSRPTEIAGTKAVLQGDGDCQEDISTSKIEGLNSPGQHDKRKGTNIESRTPEIASPGKPS